MPVDEQWKPIKDFPGYEISDLGRIRSYHKRRGGGWYISDTPQRILKGNMGRYPSVSIRNADGVIRSMRIHQLVLSAFIGPCPNGLEVCHNDGDSQNNALSNLRYDTHESNMNDTLKHAVWGIDEQDVIDIRHRRAKGETYKSIAADYSVTRTTIRSICSGNVHQHIGGPITTGKLLSRKLSDQDITGIRRLLARGDIMQMEIAKRYGVSDSLISRIKNNHRWANKSRSCQVL